MNASKTLIAAIAAATIVGTVGFVSAQTMAPATPAAQSTEPMSRPSTMTPGRQQTAPADVSAQPSVAPATEAPAPSATDRSAMSEPAPKADRN